MKIKLPDIVLDDYRVGSRQDEDLAVPKTLEPLISSEGVKLQMWDLVEASHTPTVVGSSLKLTDTFLLVAHIT